MSISVQKLEKHFGGVHAVDHLTVSFPQGAISGLLGPNGSGKTTLMHVLSGVHPIDGGSIQIESDSFSTIRDVDVYDMGISRTFQNVRVFEHMSVLDNILLTLSPRPSLASFFSSAHQHHIDRAEEVLTRVGLEEKIHAHAVHLSYGQRKLLEVARVLALDTPIALFDEVFAGMFPEMVRHVADILVSLKEEGKTVIVIEHNMELIREICDHVVVLDAGALLAEGAPAVVLSRADVIEAYLGV